VHLLVLLKVCTLLVIVYKSISTRLPTEPPTATFFHPDGEKRPSQAPGSSFWSGFELIFVRTPHAILGFPGVSRGLRMKLNQPPTPTCLLFRPDSPSHPLFPRETPLGEHTTGKLLLPTPNLPPIRTKISPDLGVGSANEWGCSNARRFFSCRKALNG
jgi:hypothetical protein